MFKKIIIPKEELQYRIDGIDNKYIINEGNRAIAIFAGTAGIMIPTQITPQDICLFILEGKMTITTDDKVFEVKEDELLMIPKMTAYSIKFVENTKAFTVRM